MLLHLGFGVHVYFSITNEVVRKVPLPFCTIIEHVVGCNVTISTTFPPPSFQQ